MRIALVCEYFYPDNSGGTPTDLSELAQFLKGRYGEIEIEVITSRNLYRASGIIGKLLPQEDWQGVKIRRLRAPKSNRPSMVMRLLAGGVFSTAALLYLLLQPRYDLVLIVTNPPANAMAAWAYAKLHGVPYVYLTHDLYPDIAVAMGRLGSGSVVTRCFRRLQRSWLNSASRVVALGRCMQQHIHQVYRVPLDRIRVINSWADPKAVTVCLRDNAFRQTNGLAGFVVLYAGNFSHYANFDQILGAAKLMLENQDITFVLIGDGVRKDELLDRINEAGLRNVRILPKVPRAAMNEVLAAADAALISLDPRMVGLGVPSKLYSIMASGRPVLAIVPTGSEVASVIEEEYCGVNVADGDAEGLARQVMRLQADPPLAQRMGRNGRSALERRFTIEQAADRFHHLFNEIVATRQGQECSSSLL